MWDTRPNSPEEREVAQSTGVLTPSASLRQSVESDDSVNRGLLAINCSQLNGPPRFEGSVNRIVRVWTIINRQGGIVDYFLEALAAV